MGKINTDNYPNRPFSSYQDDDMFVLQDNGGETYTTNVGDIKNLADSRIKLEGVQVNGSDLPISGKKVNVDISGKTDLKVIAFPFHDPEPGEPSMGFFKGAYVTYNGKLYEFTQEHQGAWNPSHVREIDVDEMYVRAGNGGYNSGDYATTEGHSTRAEGEAAHAEGTGTIANSDNQHAGGRYNVADPDDTYVRIIGNGTADNARSNALTLDWDGNLEVSGEVEDGNGEKISDKADKVTNATSDHLAGLDSNGNLTDSGVSSTEEVTVEGNPVTFDSPFEQDAKSVVVSVKPIQAGSGTPSPENIRPISGIDEVEIGVSGKNKLPLTLSAIKSANTDGTWSGNSYTYRDVVWTIQTDDGGNVTEINANGTANASSFLYLYLPTTGEQLTQDMILNGCPAGGDDATKYILAAWKDGGNMEIDEGEGVTVSSGFTLNAIYAVVRQGFNAQNLTFHPMFRLATETDPTFEPYNPNSHTTTIPLPSTLYGGEVDVTNGDADSRYGYIASYNGETLPGAWISDRDVYTGSNSPTTGAEVCYELATPTTISFTPADVELLEGTNVVSTNAEKVAVKYGRSLWQDIDDLKTDTERKLDKSDVADVEGDTASRPYSVNEFMLRADGLYKVTQPIAQNASITASNTTKTTIGAVLTALLNS